MIHLQFKVILILYQINLTLNKILLFLGDPIKNDDIMDNMLISLKDEVSENEDITFSDEESETSPKKTITFENNSLAVLKTTPGKLD